VAVKAKASELDERFRREFGAPAKGEAEVLPLVLKDKVAALVYADAGTDSQGMLEAGSLELLVLATSAWLEVNALRKQSHKEPGREQGEAVRGAGVDPVHPSTAPCAPPPPSSARAAAARAAARGPAVESTPAASESTSDVSDAAPAASSEDQETN